MLRVIQSSAASAKGYYTSSAEYYAGGRQELPGRWGGSGAAMLGLRGEVGKRAADALCENRNPATGLKLTVRQRKDRTPGYDFNFHACKSASLLYGLTGDPAILAAFRGAVDATMREIEAEIKTRVRSGGRMEDRTAGAAVWAEYTHLTARPVAGRIDPHLHSHCFVYNAVFDPEEGRWKAGQFRDLKRDAPRFEQAFHDRFAQNLAALGYPIEQTGRRWEIAGIGRPTIEAFSGRAHQVEAFAERSGIADAKARDGIAARTRERKRSDAGMDELRREWAARLTGRERAALAVACARRGFVRDDPVPLPSGPAARQDGSARPGFHSVRDRQRRMHLDRLDAHAASALPPERPIHVR